MTNSPPPFADAAPPSYDASQFDAPPPAPTPKTPTIPAAHPTPAESSTARPGPDKNDILPPTTLTVAGRFVHGPDPTAPPLYELSHSVGFLRSTDRSVRFERLEHTTLDSSSSAPRVSTRKSHLFDLKHPTLGEWAQWEFLGEAVSRRKTLCSFGLEPFRAARLSRLSLSSVASSGKGVKIQRAEFKDRRLAPVGEVLNGIPGGSGQVAFEWSDSEGRLLAREVQNGELLSLVIGTDMTVGMRDLLVAAWIARVWSELAQGRWLKLDWKQGRRYLEWERGKDRRRVAKGPGDSRTEAVHAAGGMGIDLGGAMSSGGC